MKKNDWILAGSLVLYSFLFYQEAFGINLLIFTIVMVGALLFRQPNLVRKPGWVAAALGAVLSGVCILLYGNPLSIIANILSLLLLSGLSFEPRTSVFVSILFSFYSITSSMVYMVLDGVKRWGKSDQTAGSRGKGRIFMWVLPVVLIVVFFALYRLANPAFAAYTEELFEYISIQWFGFMLLGSFILYGFLYHQTTKEVVQFDVYAPNHISPPVKESWMDTLISFINEQRSGTIVFVTLNLLLLAVNCIDFQYVWMDQPLPEGMTHTEAVHESVFALILSIIVAIGVILYYFRGRLNFGKGARALQALVLIWVLQNVFMIVSTAMRNANYIEAHALTFKRIGVYVWLGLTLIGLTITAIKIIQKKSNWFLVRYTGWSFFTVLVISCFFNWTMLVTNYNIAWSKRNNEPLDVWYLMQLEPVNHPDLIEYIVAYPDEDEYKREKNALIHRYKIMQKKAEGLTWKSYVIDNKQTLKKLHALEQRGLMEFEDANDRYSRREEWIQSKLNYTR